MAGRASRFSEQGMLLDVSECTITHTHNRTTITCITGTINNEVTQMFLDSGVSSSVVSKKHIRVPDMSPRGIFNL